MKNLFAVLLIVALAVPPPFAHAASYTRSNFRIVSFSAAATYANAAATSPNAILINAAFERRYTNDSNSADVEEAATRLGVSFDLSAAPNTQTTVSVGGGVTVTDAQLAALIRKRCETAAGL